MVLTNSIRTLSTWSNVVIDKSRITLNALTCLSKLITFSTLSPLKLGTH